MSSAARGRSGRRRRRKAGRGEPRASGGTGLLRAVLGVIGLAALFALAVRFAADGGASAADPGPAFAPPTERVRVEILNGGGIDGAARAATSRLREIGFDVVHFGNAGSFDRDSSVVIDRVGRIELARSVADALGIPDVLSRPDSNLYLEVSVLLGRDWSEAPLPAGGEDPDAGARVDPRRWFGR